ncbi:MAG TPA: Stk1 family PASTA domain-containing Ser/Thr kinase [Candidatus Limnocylindrales bacterium]|nr:Stk1 family PASTA domain-containing Ser/Thr kinase [Candidatus Limnocylindrales bacterium]
MTEIGSVLGGRYRLVELLGQGGMATIYRARDAQLDRDVAVKLLRPEFGQDPDFLARFRDEARAAASLSHPNIVAVFDFGEQDAVPYIVMELIDGQDMAAIIRENGPLPPRQAARVSAEVAKALHAAHVRGIVHRDVKPSNILVGRDGRVKVADFGIARALNESQLTLPGITMGSVHYFSPEQARGESAVQASDIYSLGIVLYEALTGQRPFSGDGAAAVALARLTSTPPRPSALRAGVPAALDQIVQRAMALEPANRYASAASMASALEGWLAEPVAGTAAGAAVVGVAAGATVASAAARPNVPYPPEAYARSGPPSPVSTRGTPPPPPPLDGEGEEGGNSPWAWIAGLLGLGILVIVGFLVFRMLTGGGGVDPSASPSGSASAAAVTVPRFVDMTLADAQAEAQRLKVALTVAGTEERTDIDPDIVIAQDPAEGQTIAEGDEVRVTLSRGRVAVAVPDLRARPENEALQLIVTEGLIVGTRTEAFDPTAPIGTVVSQNPGRGIIVAPGTAVDYVVSRGPEPTPTPTPTPIPTPPPTPAPTPTPKPTPPPTPAPVNVGDYTCSTVEIATTLIDSDGFALGTVTSDPGGTDPVPLTWIVTGQDPTPGQRKPVGTAINLVAQDPATQTACP